jgi:uncharacterized membrane protein
LAFKKAKDILFGISENLLFFLPEGYSSVLSFFWQVLVIIFILGMIYLIGYLYTHYYIGKRIRKLGQIVVSKVPVLSILYRISAQIEHTLSKKNSFKEVVLVEFPAPGIYSLGFITGENTEIFEKSLSKDLVSVFMPTTPNPTNGFLSLIEKNKVVRVNISVSNAIEYIISMGTVNVHLENGTEIK